MLWGWVPYGDASTLEMRKVNGVSKALGLLRHLVPLNCILVGYPR